MAPSLILTVSDQFIRENFSITGESFFLSLHPENYIVLHISLRFNTVRLPAIHRKKTPCKNHNQKFSI